MMSVRASLPAERQSALLPSGNTFFPSDNLCAVPWLFVLGTHHLSSTSLLKALNALPGVQLAGEGASSLFSMKDEYMNMRFRKNSTLSENEILSSLQLETISNGTIMRGFRELILPYNLMNPYSSKHFDVGAGREPEWFAFIDKQFPCAKIIFNTRQDVSSLSESDFVVQSLGEANERVRVMHAARIKKPDGASRSCF